MWYNIDFDKLGKLMLPPMFRSGVIVALIKVMLVPVKYVYGLFTAHKEESDFKLNTTGNVITLDTALCNKFGEGIYIESVSPENNIILFYKNEGQVPIYMYTESVGTSVKLELESEFEAQTNFIVYVPETLSSQINDITNFVNKYKPAGRTFSIETYTV